MSDYAIETDVPLPERERKGRPMSEERKAMLSLDIGHSFLIDDPERVHIARCLASRLDSRRFTIRKQRDGWRVWRTE